MGIKIYMGIKIEFSIRFVLRGMASLRKSSTCLLIVKPILQTLTM